ncbi:MAG: DUF4440 domain-containing protein [Pseudolabrys sp.]|nr:DUF4440 domain-containing protein [Pseudolabrys sp.]
MTTREDLLALEQKFWTGDADFYRQNLDDTCLVAFTEMSGAFTRNEIAATIKGGDRWRDVKLSPEAVVEPIAGMAFITYRAHAERANGEPYNALVSSGYVRRGKDWKMAFHQQTPLEAESKAAATG